MNDCVDGFAGPGGWDVAARELGLNPVGIEFDAAACQTRRAAGLDTVEGDIRNYGPADFPSARGLIMSPPCQTFSAAGGGSGRRNLDLVLELLHGMTVGLRPDYSRLEDDRTGLVLEPLRWALDGDYDWIALEQVPQVLPVWEAMAEVLRPEGYSVVTGVLHAEQYGVAQTRKRAILVARRLGEAQLPTPTHSRFYRSDKSRMDPGVLPWVSMEQVMKGHWSGSDLVGFPRLADTPSNSAGSGRVTLDGVDYRSRDLHRADEPSGTITEKVRSSRRWVASKVMGSGMIDRHGERPDRELDEPAFTIRANAGGLQPGGFRWQSARFGNQDHSAVRDLDEPAATLRYGARMNANHWQSEETSVRITVEEAAILQSLPGHPWQGSDTKKYQQIGNMIPRLMARAVLLAALGLGDLL